MSKRRGPSRQAMLREWESPGRTDEGPASIPDPCADGRFYDLSDDAGNVEFTRRHWHTSYGIADVMLRSPELAERAALLGHAALRAQAAQVPRAQWHARLITEIRRQAIHVAIQARASFILARARALTGNADAAEDLAQAVCLRLLTSTGWALTQGSLDAFLAAAVKHAWQDRLRCAHARKRAARLVPYDANLDAFIADEHALLPEEVLAAAELRATLTGALDQLPAEQREIIARAFFPWRGQQPQTIKQIADALDMTEDQVKYRKREALRRLRPLLRPYLPDSRNDRNRSRLRAIEVREHE